MVIQYPGLSNFSQSSTLERLAAVLLHAGRAKDMDFLKLLLRALLPVLRTESLGPHYPKRAHILILLHKGLSFDMHLGETPRDKL